MIFGAAVFTVALAFYSKAKGRHPAWCIVGFLSLPGVVALATLKDLEPEPTLPELHDP